MSRKASVSRVSATTCAGSSPATIAQNKQAIRADRRPSNTWASRGGSLARSDPSLRRTADNRVAGGACSRGVAVIEPAALSRTRAPRTYVLDTSVLLADPRALVRFDEHQIVIPIVVLMELEAKRNHPELGWAARQTLRMLEQFRTDAGSLTEPLVANPAGGTLRVELNHQDNAG